MNDITQIKNTEFQKNIDIKEALIKTECNSVYGHLIVKYFTQKIYEADLISIFGVSFGDTDNFWWEMLGNKLKSGGCKLIIFTKGDDKVPERVGYKQNRLRRKVKNYFLSKTNLSKEDIEKVIPNIYVTTNTNIFKNGIIK